MVAPEQMNSAGSAGAGQNGLVEMGVVRGAYGLKGWIKVIPWSADPQALLGYGTWWLAGLERRVLDARVHGSHLVAQIEGLASPEAARDMKGTAVCVARRDLPEPEDGSFYFSDLVGLEVFNEQGSLLGVVRGLSSHGAQDVMEVAGDRVRLLPWVDAVVKRVDLAARRIEVEWGVDW